MLWYNCFCLSTCCIQYFHIPFCTIIISFKLFPDLENVYHGILVDLLLGLVTYFEILFLLWPVHLRQGLFGPRVSFQEPEIMKKKLRMSIFSLLLDNTPNYLVGCVIQKRYFHSTIYLHLPNNHRFRIDSFSNCLSWILSTGNIGSFNSQNHSIHKIFSCLNQWGGGIQTRNYRCMGEAKYLVGGNTRSGATLISRIEVGL